MPTLFSYGSNNPEQLGVRLGRVVNGRRAWLPGYKRVYRGWSQKWGCGVASLTAAADAVVYGYVTDVTADELDHLDRFEGVRSGKYKRIQVPVQTEGGIVFAVAYVSTSREFNEPSRAYLEACAKTVSTFWKGSSGRTVTWQDFKVS